MIVVCSGIYELRIGRNIACARASLGEIAIGDDNVGVLVWIRIFVLYRVWSTNNRVVDIESKNCAGVSSAGALCQNADSRCDYGRMVDIGYHRDWIKRF